MVFRISRSVPSSLSDRSFETTVGFNLQIIRYKRLTILLGLYYTCNLGQLLNLYMLEQLCRSDNYLELSKKVYLYVYAAQL